MGKAIVLQFCATPSISSDLIEWFGHGWSSHVDTVLDDGRLLGARLDGGVKIRPADYEGFTRIQRVVLPASNAVVDAYYAFVRDQIGKPYDNLAIVGFVSGRDWRDNSKWFCSELVSAGLERSRYFPFPLVTPANKMTPEDLLLALSTRIDLHAAA